MEIEIRKGVPLPPKGHNRSKVYHFHEMQVGDSFLFPPGTTHGNAGRTCAYYSKTLNRKFVTRKTPEGIGCWRVA